MADRLKEDILSYLIKKTGLSAESIRPQLSVLKRKYPALTLNAAAQLFAQKHDTSIMPKLSDEDKRDLSQVQVQIVRVSTKEEARVRKTKEVVFLEYTTNDRFVRKHLEEINKAYNAGCYTATFILCRKVMENLIIDILKKQFPAHLDKALYEGNGRFLDFSVVLDNLYKKRTAFSTTACKAVERVKQKTGPFKSDANNKAHSLFHIATKTEMDNAGVQEIFDLIVKINKEVGI